VLLTYDNGSFSLLVAPYVADQNQSAAVPIVGNLPFPLNLQLFHFWPRALYLVKREYTLDRKSHSYSGQSYELKDVTWSYN
jgi:hypothetical protein